MFYKVLFTKSVHVFIFQNNVKIVFQKNFRKWSRKLISKTHNVKMYVWNYFSRTVFLRTYLNTKYGVWLEDELLMKI